MQSAAEDLRGDRESLLDRVREKGFVLRNTSDDLKRDREIVLEAVTPSVLQEGPQAAIAEYNAEASTPSGGNKRGEPLRFVLASHVALDQVLHPFACMRSVLELRCDLVVCVAQAQVSDGAPLPCPSRRLAGTLRRVQLWLNSHRCPCALFEAASGGTANMRWINMVHRNSDVR